MRPKRVRDTRQHCCSTVAALLQHCCSTVAALLQHCWFETPGGEGATTATSTTTAIIYIIIIIIIIIAAAADRLFPAQVDAAQPRRLRVRLVQRREEGVPQRLRVCV